MIIPLGVNSVKGSKDKPETSFGRDRFGDITRNQVGRVSGLIKKERLDRAALTDRLTDRRTGASDA